MTTFHIPDMSCGHCRAAVTKAIHGLDPAARIDFDMETRRITVDSVAETARVQSALAEAGFPATPS